MVSPRPRCWSCRTILDLTPGRPIGRSETCPECDADLRACRMCAHWDQGQRACREPTAEVPADAERRNFCGAFQLVGPAVEREGGSAPAAAGGSDPAAEAKRRLEALFKK